MQDDLTGLNVFVAVAEQRSFRAAGEHLGVTGSAVSQSIRQLEDRLGVSLLQRTTRSVGLTEAGEQLYRGLKPALADVRTTLGSLDELRAKPSGTLRLNVSSISESFLTSAVLAEFLGEYPDIKLDVAIDDGVSDIVADGFDAGVRLGETIDEAMIAVSVTGEQRQRVVGSPGYLRKHGKPKHPRDLHQHACIGWRQYANPRPYRWEFSERGKDFDVEIDARLNTNDMGLMIRLACAGVGLTIGMDESFRAYLNRGQLVSVLDRFCTPFPGFFLYYPKRSQTPLKLKALVEFLRRKRAQSS